MPEIMENATKHYILIKIQPVKMHNINIRVTN